MARFGRYSKANGTSPDLTRDVSPRQIAPNSAHRRSSDAEEFASTFRSHPPLQRPQRGNLFFSKLREGVTAAGHSRGSALCNHVGRIFRGRSDPQVSGVNTAAIVACVADLIAGWNLAASNLIGKPVGDDGRGRSMLETSDPAVAAGIESAGPFPAFVRKPLVHLRPKPCFGGWHSIFEHHGCDYVIRPECSQGAR